MLSPAALGSAAGVATGVAAAAAGVAAGGVPCDTGCRAGSGGSVADAHVDPSVSSTPDNSAATSPGVGEEVGLASALSSASKASSSSFSSRGNTEKEAKGEGLKPPEDALCTESPGSPVDRSLSNPDLPRLWWPASNEECARSDSASRAEAEEAMDMLLYDSGGLPTELGGIVGRGAPMGIMESGALASMLLRPHGRHSPAPIA